MPGDANKTSPSGSPDSRSADSSRPTAVKSSKGRDGTGDNSRNDQTSSKEVPNHHKKRGTATPSSLVALHRKGYILDGATTLGSGAYAKVKVGTSLKMNIQVAIKIVNKLSTPKEVVERFLPREIETMNAVSNDHIIKLHEVIETPETLFFVMELADKGDLLDFINERKYLSERLARGFFSDLVKGVEHCHSRGVVHRDLKCENLLLDSHMRLKISDFGFARKFDGNLRTFCGSFAYAAPEVILGNPYNGPLADIWSMGVILYAMVTGRLPFKDTSTSVLMADIAAGVKFSSRHTDKLRSLVCKILKFLPQERADMACIQSHPWLNVPLSLSLPPNSTSSTTAEKQELPCPPKRSRGEGVSFDQQKPRPISNRKVSQAEGKESTPNKGTNETDSPTTSSSSTNAIKGTNETLCVPIKDTGKVSFMRKSSGARKTSLPNEDIIEKFTNSRRRKTVPDIFPEGVPPTLKSKIAAIVTDDVKLREDSISGLSTTSSASPSSKVILNTKTAFHSVSRYEKRK